jgi:hypothetical protein
MVKKNLVKNPERDSGGRKWAELHDEAKKKLEPPFLDKGTKNNHSHSSPLAPDISIGFLDYYTHYSTLTPFTLMRHQADGTTNGYKEKA